MTAPATAPPASPGDVFAALGDPTRRELLRTLVDEGSTSASALARKLPISRQAVGKHLTVLGSAGLVVPRRAGREVRFEPRLQPLEESSRWMADLARRWERRLDALATLAETDQ